MILLKWSAKNLRVHADSAIEFPDVQRFGIIGDNESGKSTIVETLLWAIYGAKAIRKTMKGLRWHGAAGNAKAETNWLIDLAGVIHDVTRTETGGSVYVDGKKMADGTTGVTEYMTARVGKSYNEFVLTHICQQDDVKRYALMSPAERQKFIRDLLGVGRVDEGLVECRADLKDKKAEKEGMAAGLGDRWPLEEAKESASIGVVRAAGAVVIASDGLDDADAALAIASEDDSDYKGKVTEYTDLATKRDKAAEDRASAEKLMLGHQANANGVTLARFRIEKEAGALDDLPGLEAEVAELRDAEKKAADRVRAIQDFDRTLKAWSDAQDEGLANDAVIGAHDEGAYRAANLKAENANKIVASMEAERRDRVAQAHAELKASREEGARVEFRLFAIRDAGISGACPTCMRELGDAFAAVAEKLVEEVDRCTAREGVAAASALTLRSPSREEEVARDAAVTAEKEFEPLLEMRRAAEGARNNVEGLLEKCALAEGEARVARDAKEATPQVALDAARLADAEQEIEDLQKLDKDLEAARITAATHEEVEKSIAETEGAIVVADKAVDEFSTAIRSLDFSPHTERGTQLSDALKEAEEARTTAHGVMTAAKATHRATLVSMDEKEEALVRYDAKAETLVAITDEIVLLEYVETKLADFRVAIAATIRPELEELMSGYIHILTDGRHDSAILTETFEVVLSEDGVETEVISGGTEVVAALAMRLALSHMIAERSGQPLSLLWLDEPFGALDENRRGNVLRLIEALGSVFEQIVVVSHVAETKDAVDRVISLEYDPATRRAIVMEAA